MIRRGGENRIQVNRRDAQSLQIVQFVRYAMQIAALIPLLFGRRAPRLEGEAARMNHAGTAGKAIWKNLIKHGVFRPFRRGDVHRRSKNA